MHPLRAAMALSPGLALAACAATTSPQATTPAARPGAPPLSPDLQSLAFYVGHWECDGIHCQEDGRAADSWKATIDVAPELDGTWLSVHMKGPGENRTIEHKGFEQREKRCVKAVDRGAAGPTEAAG